jgi:hypothetical protein
MKCPFMGGHLEIDSLIELGNIQEESNMGGRKIDDLLQRSNSSHLSPL